MPRYTTSTGVPLGFAQPGTRRERELLARGAVEAGGSIRPADPANSGLLSRTVDQVLTDVADFDRPALAQVLTDERSGRARSTLLEGVQTLIDTLDRETRAREEAGL